MSDNQGASRNRDTGLENFAAELTSAVYPIALRHGMNGSWLKVELALWRVLAETVRKCACERPPTESSDEFKAWQDGLLVDLTESAFYIAVKHGIKGSLLGLELDLYQTFRSVIDRIACGCRYDATPTMAASDWTSPR
jgi:hypothetical protein